MQKRCGLCGTPISPTQNLVLEKQFEIQGVKTVEKYFGTRTCCHIVDSEIERFFGIGAALWRQSFSIPILKKSDRIGWTVGSTLYRELDSIDGGPVVFEWKISPRRTALQLPQEVHKVMGEEPSITPQDFKIHIIFMSMYNSVNWNRKGNEAVQMTTRHVLTNTPKVFLKDIGHSSDLEKKFGVLHSLTSRMDYGAEPQKK